MLGRIVSRGRVALGKRWLDLHEYQSKELMASYGIRVQRGAVASTPAEALATAQGLNAEELVIKAQILAGGRGKGTFNTGFKGGVKITKDPKEIESYAAEMIGNKLVTKQTGEEGQLCSRVLVHEGVTFDKELYLAIVMDRAHGGPVIVCSRQGGMDIEEVAETNPEAIHTVPVDIIEGITSEQTRKVAELLGFESESDISDAMVQVTRLYDLFIGCDSTQVEINPLVVTNSGKVFCVDAKIGFDDNASFRQKELFAMRDTSMEDPREVDASKHHLNYIGLDGMLFLLYVYILICFLGEIGCMVNGAGLAMATMDIIKLYGGTPANFLDVGGNANADQIAQAFRILQSDTKVKAILVNVFGGIMRCDIIADGIVSAASKVSLSVPLVVRLAGTNADKGSEILNNSGLNIVAATDLDDAAVKAVKSLK